MGTAGEQSMVRNGHVYTANGLPTVNAYTAFSTHAHSLPMLTLPMLTLLTTLTLLPTLTLYPRPVSTHGQQGYFCDSLPTVSLYPRSAGRSAGGYFCDSLPTVSIATSVTLYPRSAWQFSTHKIE